MSTGPCINLVLTLDNFHVIFPLFLPFPVPHPPRWFLFETVTWQHLYCVFTYIYSLLIEKETSVIVETYQLSSVCLLELFIQRSLHFFDKSFLFQFLFWCFPYFGTSHFHRVCFKCRH